MSEIAYPPVQQALDRIKYLSGDAETRRLAFVRERALHDEISELRAEREKGKIEGKIEGKLEGKIEGKLEGKIEGKVEVARNLKALGIADEVIMRTTGLSREEIEGLTL